MQHYFDLLFRHDSLKKLYNIMPIKQVRSSYNIHTGSTDFGGSLSVAEIDDLEKIVPSASNRISFSGATITDVKNVITALLTADTALIKSLTSESATIDTLTSDVATVRDFNATTVTTQNLNSSTAAIVLARIQNLIADTGRFDSIVSRLIDATRITTQNIVAAAGDITLLTSDSLISRIANISQLTAISLTAATARITNLTSQVITAATASITTDLNVGGSLTATTASVTTDLNVGGSLTASNIVSTVLTVTADPQGFYTWTHAALRPPVAHFLMAESGEVVRMMSTTPSSARFFLYTDAPLRMHFLAIGR
jgi:hypothetical protein